MRNRKIIRQINRVVRDMHEKYEIVSELFTDSNDSFLFMSIITDKNHPVCELYKTLLYNYLMDVRNTHDAAISQYNRYTRELLVYLNRNDTTRDYAPYMNDFGFIGRVGCEAFFEVVFLKSSLFHDNRKHD